MSAPAYALDLEPVDHGSPERALWCAALALMLEDARRTTTPEKMLQA